MKSMITGLIALGLLNSALAADRAELNARIGVLIAKFNAMQQDPAERVPSEVLRQAKGVVLLDRVKAGFMFGGESGGGVAIVKDNSGDWSPAAFIHSAGGSFGFQAGGEEDFCVILLMNSEVAHQLADSKIAFSSEARATAGSDTAGVEDKFNAPPQSVLVYADRSGLYGGVSLKGAGLSPDRKANEIYYGNPVSLYDILFEPKVAVTPTVQSLARAMEVYSRQ